LIVIPAVSDIWGLNSLTMRMLENAAGTILGTTRLFRKGTNLVGKRFVAITTLGTSALKYIMWLKPALEELGHEVALFHVGGGQGWTLRQLLDQGVIEGLLDLCLIDFLPMRRGFLYAPERLEAAGKKGIPQVIAPGGLDMCAWAGPINTLPKSFRQRRRHQHGEMTSAIERSLDEVAKAAELIATRLNKGQGPRVIVIPKLGFSEWDKPGGIFYQPERTKVFTQALTAKLSPEVRVVKLDLHINDQAFAEEVARLFGSLVSKQATN
jgi:uncharacterized protein (UPF0261 family)